MNHFSSIPYGLIKGRYEGQLEIYHVKLITEIALSPVKFSDTETIPFSC